MADHRTAPRPLISAQFAPKRIKRQKILSYTVLVAGAALTALLALANPVRIDAGTLALGLLLALGFLLAERLSIDFDVRQVTWNISFVEIPLVLGVVTLPFQVIITAAVAAAITIQVARHKLSRFSYNVGVVCLEVVISYSGFKFLSNQFGSEMPQWPAALLAVLGSALVSTILGLILLHILGVQSRLASGVLFSLRTLVVALLNTSAGLVAFELIKTVPWGWALALLIAAAMIALYRAYSGLLREQRDLETLSDISLTVARLGQGNVDLSTALTASGAKEDFVDWEVIAERIRDQLNAKRVVLHLRSDQADVQTLIAGQAQPENMAICGIAELRADPILQLAGSQVRYFSLSDAADDIQHALQRRGAYEVLVVPLRGANHLLGVIEVHDRVSRWRGFSRADLRLLRTMASHLATAMDNRGLLGKLRHDAYHDLLTGLLNRVGLREVAAAIALENQRFVALRIDLNVMSGVADALGYAWGDRLVIAAGKRLRARLGAEVPLARLEGGSFAALLTGAIVDRVQQFGEELRAELATPYPVEKLSIEAGAHVGYALSNGEEDMETMLQQADVAVRAAKTGSDPVRGYVSSMGQIFLRRFQLVSQFRQALETGQIQVHYQPKIALPCRELVGAEALVRWRHPEFGPLDPDEFVPAVEATGLVDVLTAFVLEQGLRRVRTWLDRGLQISTAVNLSMRNLVDTSFPDQVALALDRNRVQPQLLTLELTESSVMSDPERVLPVLRRLHTMGVVIAVDDFGTGYSSLAYLRQLPVDEVKIDKSFVLGMGTDLSDMAVVRSIIELGHSLGLKVVAEGVEDDAAREQLVEMGCDVAQGYLISRPLPEDRFDAWIQARTVRVTDARDNTVLTLVN